MKITHPQAGVVPSTSTDGQHSPAAEQADWYKDAIIYELHVKAFLDSNGDGSGDFAGLVEKLDYIADLGVTAIWLLPFYPSPLRDDGYDIADYTSVHPAYGTLRQFRTFVREAHRRGLRVITELVVNHTSDQHPWFVESRQDGTGAKRDWYVWSEDDQRYRDARIIFTDTEGSNWAWDNQRRAYYWHRFFSHQPDLNWDNPQVFRAIQRVMRFFSTWGSTGSGSTRCRTSSNARRPTARTCRRPTASCVACAPRWMSAIRAGCSLPRPTSGRPMCAPTSGTAMNATWPSTSR